MPEVSIIMCAYNTGCFIETAIKSVLCSSVDDWELLVADDGSSDDTRAIINTYAQQDCRIKPHHNSTNLGIARTRNKLLSFVSGRNIAFLDADDWMAPSKLEKQLVALADHQMEAVGVNYIRVDLDGNMHVNQEGCFKTRLTKRDIHQLPFWPPSIMITKALFDRVGGYHPFFTCYEDKYWLFDVLETADVAFINEPLYYYRHNPSSITRTLNFRRLASRQLIAELIRQRSDYGTDWLRSGQFDLAEQYITTLLNNPRWQGECCRTYAAIKTDERYFAQAARLLVKAWQQFPTNKALYQTAFYWLRSVANPFNHFRHSQTGTESQSLLLDYD